MHATIFEVPIDGDFQNPDSGRRSIAMNTTKLAS